MRKAKPRARPIKEAIPQVSSRQLTDALFEAIPELNEALSRAEFELAMEDRGYQGLSPNWGADLTPASRKIIIQKSRLAWRTDPLAKQAVRVWTTYCLGNGLTYEAEDPKVQKEIDAFFKSPRNEALLSPANQQVLSNQLLIDGDLFFTVFQTDPVPSLRTIDALQIEDIISDPDDEKTILCYRRKLANDKTLYYADWTLDEEAIAKVDGEMKDEGDQNRVITLERDDNKEIIRVYHLAFDRFGKWGNGLLVCALNWTREHSRFMVSRVAIAQALAKFASKLTVKGGQTAVNAAAARFQSSLTAGGLDSGRERNPTNAPGATFLQNAGIDLQATPRSTGAGDATGDSNNLIRMVCAATGVFFHYLTGDPSTGNLATATAMELPMLKEFTSYQELWRGGYRRILGIARQEDPNEEPDEITIELPAIVDEDLAKLGSYIQQLTTVFPETKIPEILREFLLPFGVEDIDDLMKKIIAQRKKIDAQIEKDRQQAQANIEMSAKPAAVVPTDKPAPASVAEVAALDRLTKVLEEGNRMPAMTPIIPEISVNPQIVIAQEQGKAVVKTGRAKREANGDMTITIEEHRNGNENL